MEKNNTMIHAVWDRVSERLAKENTELETIHVDEIMASIFCPGPSYYYIVDFFDRQITFMSPKIQNILGLDPLKVTSKDILDSIHPDDLDYVIRAEETVIHFLNNGIDPGKVRNYKASYCCRFKTANGSYQLFQHQSIILSTDEQGNFGKTLNVHSNISHFTSVNNNKVSMMGLFGEDSFTLIDVLPLTHPKSHSSLFTKREIEIIRLISQGLKNQEIAYRLFISLNTVKNHRKNIMQKACVSSSSELISKCIHLGHI